MILCFLISIVSSVILLLWLLHLQKCEPYPRGEILIMLAWGFWSAFAVGLTFWLLDEINVFEIISGSNRLLFVFFDNFLGAAIPEELVKYIIAVILIKRNALRDTKFHVAMCCSYVAIGFQIVEDILFAMDGTISTAIARAVVPFHFTYGALMGVFLGRAMTTGKKHYRFLALFLPIMIHGIFDLLVGLVDFSDWFLLLLLIFYVLVLELTGLMIVVITIMSENIPKKSGELS